MTRILLLIIILIVAGCKKKPDHTEEYKKRIVGDWESTVISDTLEDGIIQVPLMPVSTYGLLFNKDGSYEFKNGFLEFTENHEIKFYGTFSQYKIENDSLKLHYPQTGWLSQKIMKLTKDSMVLDEGKFVRTYFKKNYDTIQSTHFDAIVFSASPCFGDCPVNDIYIKSEGDVIYNGEDYNENNGYYTSQLSKKEFNRIVTRFKKADYEHLQNSYTQFITDSQEISISIIKDDKIIKSITDYSFSSPDIFIRAYAPLLFISQHLELIPAAKNDYIGLPFVEFKKGDEVLELTDSENFYLTMLIQNGKEVNEKFENKYQVVWGIDHRPFFETDGRFYKYTTSSSIVKTIDIGSNFLEGNNFVNQFIHVKANK